MKNNENRPNFLFIMTDQHRADFLGCYGGDFVNTPNLDRIAQTGIRFEKCFTNTPLCAPARIGLATGLQPCRVGSLNNKSYLPLSHATYYQRLRDNGYLTGCVGKLDLAKPSKEIGKTGERPYAFSLGFTHPHECEGKMEAANTTEPRGPYGEFLKRKGLFEKFKEDYHERQNLGWTTGADQDSILSEDCFEDSYIGQKAVDFIKNMDNGYPWHFFVSFVGPHDPYDPPSSFAEKYRNAPVPEPIECVREKRPSWIRSRQSEPDLDAVLHTRRQYCAEIELIDSWIGRIIDTLESRDMLDNTYIIFTSDHGDLMGDHGMYQKRKPYESAIKVPLMISGPDITGGMVSDALIELIDLNPTICSLAGIPPQENIDAKSFEGILAGTSENHRENIVTAVDNFRCIRTDRFKYVKNFNDLTELYDLEKDPFELNNIAEENPEKTQELGQTLLERFMEGGIQR